MWLAGITSRCTALAVGSIAFTASMPASTVLRVPPEVWMISGLSSALSCICSAMKSESIWLASQPSPMITTPAKFGWRQ